MSTKESQINNNVENSNKEYFYKARRSLIISSSLLFGFSLAGLKVINKSSDQISIDISNKSDLKISLENPDSLPLLLSIVVIYFIFRLILEWHQISFSIRKFSINKIDYFASLSIGVSAVLSFLIVTLTKLNLNEIIDAKLLFVVILSFVIGQIISFPVNFFKQNKNVRFNKKLVGLLIMTLVSIIFQLLFIVYFGSQTGYPLVTFSIGIVVVIISLLLFTRKAIYERIYNFVYRTSTKS